MWWDLTTTASTLLHLVSHSIRLTEDRARDLLLTVFHKEGKGKDTPIRSMKCLQDMNKIHKISREMYMPAVQQDCKSPATYMQGARQIRFAGIRFRKN
jgi:hypothetical protein